MYYVALFLNFLTLLALWKQRNNHDKLLVIAIVSIIQLAFTKFGIQIEGNFQYYAAGVITDIGTIAILGYVSRTRFSFDLQVISFASCIINVLGWFMYEAGASSFYYNTAGTILLMVQLARMLIETPKERDDAASDRLWALVREFNHIRGEATKEKSAKLAQKPVTPVL